jgi:hypothetical protein
MNMLVGAFGNTATDDGEVFLLVASRRMRINESGFARDQGATPHNIWFHIK